jgi:hypothetical protein
LPVPAFSAENLALRLLNTAYDYNLENLNREQNNYPAIDLGDHERGIAFQVTASDELRKIKETVTKFYAPDGPHKEFSNGLYFFFIKEKAPALRKETKDAEQEGTADADKSFTPRTGSVSCGSRTSWQRNGGVGLVKSTAARCWKNCTGDQSVTWLRYGAAVDGFAI